MRTRWIVLILLAAVWPLAGYGDAASASNLANQADRSDASGPNGNLVTAPAALDAASVVQAAALQSSGVSGVENDGGVSTTASSGGAEFVSRAKIGTQNGYLSVELDTYPSIGTASSGYQASSTSSDNNWVSISGVGDEAEVTQSPVGATDLSRFNCASPTPADTIICSRLLQSAGSELSSGEAIVRKGGQVLTVGFAPSAALQAQLEQAKATDSYGSLLPAIEAVSTTVQNAAEAIAAHLGGRTASRGYLELPPHAINPCLISAQKLDAELHQQVSAEPGPTLAGDGPAVTCDYSVGGEPFLMETETEAQAAASVPPTTLQALYQKDFNDNGGASNPDHKTVGSSSAFMVPGEDWTSETLLADGAESAAFSRPGSGFELASDYRIRPGVLVRVENEETFPINREQCEYFVGMVARLDLIPAYDPELSRALLQSAKDWCVNYPETLPGETTTSDPREFPPNPDRVGRG